VGTIYVYGIETHEEEEEEEEEERIHERDL